MVRPIWCDKCPILLHCPHRESHAAMYLVSIEGHIIDDIDAEKFERMTKLMERAVENCPLLKLLRIEDEE